jgi:hypothetical protein
MATLLRQWLVRDIDRELSSGIDWAIAGDKIKREDEEEQDGGERSPKSKKARQRRIDLLAALPYENDGSNLRISVSHEVEESRCLQILKAGGSLSPCVALS